MKNHGLGLLLLTAREKEKISLARLSKIIKVNPATLSRIELGKDFHPRTAMKILLWLGTLEDKK